MTHKIGVAAVFRKFKQDERGSITLEFVIWVPFLLFWLIFSLGVFLAMENRYDSMQATIAISDIISKNKKPLNRNKLENYRVLAQQLLPNEASGSAMRISSISFNNDAFSVEWTECFGDIPPLTDETIPLSIIPAMENGGRPVILTETYVPYFPISDRWLPSSLIWRIGIVSRPRFGKLENNSGDIANCQELPS